MTRVLPASPNWYYSKIVDISQDDIVAYGARSDVNILQLHVKPKNQNDNSPLPILSKNNDCCNAQAKGEASDPRPQGVTNRSHNSAVDADESEDVQALSGDVCCKNISGELPTAITNKTFKRVYEGTKNKSNPNDTLPQINSRRSNSKYADCVLICTLSRVHKDKITAVRLLKQELAEGKGSKQQDVYFAYSLFTGSDDGKVKNHSLRWEGNALEKLPLISSKLESEYSLPQNVCCTAHLAF